MDLADVYKQQVKPTAISTYSFGGQAPTMIKDPNANAFERSVFERLRSVIPVEHAQTPVIPEAPVVNHVSFEDALRELAAMNK